MKENHMGFEKGISNNMQTNCLGLGLATPLLHFTELHCTIVNSVNCGV